MILIDDVKKYVEKAQRNTFGTIGTVGASLVGLPAASLLGLAELVQGKSRQEAAKVVAAGYSGFVEGAGDFGYKHGPAISDFLFHMIGEISKEQARARAGESRES
jgi:hypothetical protein